MEWNPDILFKASDSTGRDDQVIRRGLLAVLIDGLAAAVIFGGIYFVSYKIPHTGGFQAVSAEAGAESGNLSGTAGVEEDWHETFADKFTPQVVSTDTTYSSPDLYVELSYYSGDTGRLDRSEAGKHLQYGTKTAYMIADIYVGDISCFRTGFAQDTYGIGFDEKLSDMSARMHSVLSINGDSYSNNRHRDNGTIIRNGVLYRDRNTDMETCVLFRDGTMKIYGPQGVSAAQLMREGAYQSWIFGPSLLDSEGKAKTSFLTWDYIRESHPRTAIGYYEPGHYCFLVADGRQKDYSRGLFLEEMAKVFEDLGCRAAYNLDGGHCSFMVKEGKTVSHPYKPEHKISDGIFLVEGSVQ